MEQFKQTISELQTAVTTAYQQLERLSTAKSYSTSTAERLIVDYMCEIETLCIKSRIMLDRYRKEQNSNRSINANTAISSIAGNIEVTTEGWLHITLNTLLPNCRRRVSEYISDTISRLLSSYEYELPYYDKAFLAVVEYCNYEKHNSLDNDNKAWKMIPNALKGRVIDDDSQFILSIGLFAKLSEDVRCEIYVLPPEEGGIFMDMLSSDTL